MSDPLTTDAALAVPPAQLPIHPKEGLMMRIGAAFWFAVLCGVPLIPISVLIGLRFWTVPVVVTGLGLGIWLGLRFGRAEHRLYEVHKLADGLLVKRGVFWRTEIFVPRSRIQHTDVNQGPLDRRWAMATLTLHTAGTHAEKIEVSGLHQPDALRLRDELLNRQEGSDGA